MDNIKDVSWCNEGKHIVPRESITHINTSKQNVHRRLCTDCKNRLVDIRKAKAKLPLPVAVA